MRKTCWQSLRAKSLPSGGEWWRKRTTATMVNMAASVLLFWRRENIRVPVYSRWKQETLFLLSSNHGIGIISSSPPFKLQPTRFTVPHSSPWCWSLDGSIDFGNPGEACRIVHPQCLLGRWKWNWSRRWIWDRRISSAVTMSVWPANSSRIPSIHTCLSTLMKFMSTGPPPNRKRSAQHGMKVSSQKCKREPT